MKFNNSEIHYDTRGFSFYLLMGYFGHKMGNIAIFGFDVFNFLLVKIFQDFFLNLRVKNV